ncbi:uncharacterized protein PFL1_01938 [Pseudozyma flocculosa PF-1]|uniref:DNA-directed RNA polymerase subunit n=1 Tax=Pseudozyma flocculosa TaxID=84751 RepID=A0A5C3F195_9BASI|nr:uncharacterized protein PFL1_01938 [Pseudozyma flocculosa PF-1]EPQ30412.1 hypothetical protein PFL1_01938 [Pseudozyma flocculosa PF-1]SPO37487.1 related to DNA-directed RNA polymerase I [Pseudozyma flocculosa]
MDVTRPITSNISSTSFSFLSAEEIRRISVTQIYNPELLDITNNASAGGLYDLHLGPMKHAEICKTCHMDGFRCPGHFGHIELPAPVYHPLFLLRMYSVLQSMCLFCHKFRMTEFQAIKFAARFRLLEYGLVQEAEDVGNMELRRSHRFTFADARSDGKANEKKKAKKGEQQSDDDEEEDEDAENDEDAGKKFRLVQDDSKPSESVAEFKVRVDAHVEQLIQQAIKEGKSNTSELLEAPYVARNKLIAEVFKPKTNARCERCSAFRTKLRRDGHLKIMEKSSGAAAAAARQAIEEIESGVDGSKKSKAKSKADDANGMDVDDDDDDDEDSDATPAPTAASDKAALNKAMSAGASEHDGLWRIVPPAEIRSHMRLLFKNESELCSLIFGRHGAFQNLADPGKPRRSMKGEALWETPNGASADNFFVEALAVPPTRFRPASVMGDQTFENPQNELLTKILKTSFRLRDLNQELTSIAFDKSYGDLGPAATRDEQLQAQQKWQRQRDEAYQKVLEAMVQLQVDVNSYMDSSKNPTLTRAGQAPTPGVKQGLEKKEGLFRKHMMGKRVNFAARSVISPDVNIETNEIGVPPVFAQKLTFPEPVTVHNVELMRQLVINGPKKYPGAAAIRMEDGYEVLLEKKTLEERTAIANQLLTPQGNTSRHNKGSFGGLGSSARTPTANKQVLRHLRDGDILLLNRQPTLHKASMMAHKARVLTGERTIRMHYANCNSYNADFDGDEMNMHFPQSQAARSELYNIAFTDKQYLVPTSGEPLRGLIQDHVVAGVWMTSKNTLYTREEYQQMLYGALRPENGYTGGGRVLTVPPAVVKPQPLWTGKQVISTVLLNLKPAKAHGINLVSKAKVGGRNWGKDHASEAEVIVEDGELLCGVLDKSQFGAVSKGLVHSVYEVYGPEYAGKLLSIFSRLFTKFLQANAFSCRMDDLMLTPEGDAQRRRILDERRAEGRTVALKTVGLENEDPTRPETDRNLRIRLEEVLRDRNKQAMLDSDMMGSVNTITSSLIDQCIPDFLYKKFPHNNMQMMTVSGAKGSMVNVSQISCLLGQQALEGRRVPVMISGKTLPSFKPFDTSARAGGFIGGRFLSGIRPQEYYFHCMAGREGLIDTAVKTSRSGYLQRCLIKHLEGAHVQYDHTVRNSDGAVLQFAYGEDALDTTKSAFLNQFDFMAQNFDNFCKRYDPAQLADVMEAERAPKHMKKALKKPDQYPPVLSVYSPATHFGSMSEAFAAKVEKYIEENPRKLLGEKRKKKKQRKSEGGKGGGADDEPVEKLRSVRDKLGVEAFRAMAKVLYHRGLVEPGEAVGLLAAQGVGEPSTQMTLNTFHFAGHGAANVTLGIPRLREIVMTASQNIQTPIMHLPVLDGITAEQMKTFCKDGSRLTLSQVVDEAVITEIISGKTADNGFSRQRTYTLRLNFYPLAECREEYNMTLEQLFSGLEKTFIATLEREITKELARMKRDRQAQAAAIGKAHSASSNHDDDTAGPSAGRAAAAASSSSSGADAKSRSQNADMDDSDDDGADSDGGDGDADDAKRSSRRKGKVSYDDDDDDDAQRVPDTDEGIEAAFRDDDDDEALRDAGKDGDDDDDRDQHRDDLASRADIAERAGKLDDECSTFTKFISGFRFDSRRGQYAEIDLQLPTTEKVLLISAVERACQTSVVREIPFITRVLRPVASKKDDSRPRLTAEGINFRDLWTFAYGVVDLDRIETNDIGALLHTYGVEAARQAIVNEMKAIFDTYGIGVSMRHLYLIADYQTAAGGFRPFSRGGIAQSASVFLKASYETTMNFIGNAALHGEYESLTGPSANIVVGKPVKSGTGVPEIRVALPRPNLVDAAAA